MIHIFILYICVQLFEQRIYTPDWMKQTCHTAHLNWIFVKLYPFVLALFWPDAVCFINLQCNLHSLQDRSIRNVGVKACALHTIPLMCPFTSCISPIYAVTDMVCTVQVHRIQCTPSSKGRCAVHTSTTYVMEQLHTSILFQVDIVWQSMQNHPQRSKCNVDVLT